MSPIPSPLAIPAHESQAAVGWSGFVLYAHCPYGVRAEAGNQATFICKLTKLLVYCAND